MGKRNRQQFSASGKEIHSKNQRGGKRIQLLVRIYSPAEQEKEQTQAKEEEK